MPDPDSVAPPGSASALEASSVSDPGPTQPHEGERLIPPGNRWRPWSFVPALGASLVPLLVMCTDLHFALSVPLGALFFLVSALCLLDGLGTFDDQMDGEVVTTRALLPRGLELASSCFVLIAGLRLIVAGRMPGGIALAGAFVTVSVTWCLVAAFRVLAQLGAVDRERPLLRRFGFWLLLLNFVLYLPLLGSYSLSDPWETHYGEVAREMLARDDWISTWWAQENFFWSKPVLDFWLQALSFSALGVRFQPDQMLAAAGSGLIPRPEWAARLPIVLLTFAATYALYRAVSQRFGARAGFLGGLVLTTLPYWYLIAHQSMTDMPYVAPLTAALALVLLGLGTDPEARVTVHGVRLGRRVFGVSAFHLLFGLLLLSALPQIFYLLSRHLTWQLAAPPYGFRLHFDEVLFGSAGNCGIPGNESCRVQDPVDTTLQPGTAAAIWLGVTAVLLYVNRGERRTQRLLFLAAWYATALSALAKGAPGLVLPLAIAIGGVLVTRRFRDLTRLELVGLVLIIGCVCLPWYVQMYARHGSPFTDRLLFHDMYKRAFVHVHDTNTGDDVSFRYYVWQLGYGLFPWTGLAAAGLLTFQREGDEAKSARAEALGFLALWFGFAFFLFSASLTKFHHYILPAVPPIAMLCGITIDRAFPGLVPRGRKLAAYVGVIGLSALLLLYGVFRLMPGSLLGSVPPPPASVPLAIACLVVGLLAFVFAARLWPGERDATLEPFSAAVMWLFAVGAIAVVVLVGRDLFAADDPDGPARLTHLASYNYKRPWPDTLEFRPMFAAITACVALALAALLVTRLRPHALALLAAVAIWATAWTLDVYVVRAAPHWGQRETLIAYYAKRRGPEEPLIAFQMNWKGENFYTGNHVPAFVSSGAKFKRWLEEERERGTRIFYVTTEHSRESGLKTELGEVQRYERLTTRALNNKFFLARVEL
jgi:4-amino-4-deoxy-L-arabinose transferase-like glycosyltransferase